MQVGDVSRCAALPDAGQWSGTLTRRGPVGTEQPGQVPYNFKLVAVDCCRDTNRSPPHLDGWLGAKQTHSQSRHSHHLPAPSFLFGHPLGGQDKDGTENHQPLDSAADKDRRTATEFPCQSLDDLIDGESSKSAAVIEELRQLIQCGGRCC